MPPSAASPLAEIDNPQERVKMALKLDALGGADAWHQREQIKQALESAHHWSPHDLKLAARLFNFYCLFFYYHPDSWGRNTGRLTAGLLERDSQPQSLARDFLLPSAAALADLTRPARAKQLLELVAVQYRTQQWQQAKQAVEAAWRRHEARERRWAWLKDKDATDPQLQGEYAQQLDDLAWPRYPALAWPWVGRYHLLNAARGCEAL